MNRIARRALALLLLTFALLFGLCFFLWEYVTQAGQWVMHPGSPHVYDEGRLASGILTDRSGEPLLDLSGGRTYHSDPLTRRSTLHWLGDREGNISTPLYGYYALTMTGYDLVNGLYHYGSQPAQMRLTLSAQAQNAALEAMDGRRGTIAVYNYKTGALLCAISTPTFDPNNVPDIAGDATGAYEGAYLNRFLQVSYVPGSIFKIVTLSAALDSVPDILDHTFTCTGVYEMEGGEVTCERAHGEQDLETAFANSCNCAFAQVMELLGGDTLERYVKQLGILEPVSFDGFTSESGNFDIQNAAPVQIAWSGIGQHKDLINPCRYLSFVGAVANGGAGVLPHLVDRVELGGREVYTAQPQREDRILSIQLAKTLQDYMRNNVATNYGDENFPGLTVCAKSGTGEVGSERRPNAMFTGFVMDEEYPLAFFVAVEDGGYGSQVCVPIISQVLAVCKEVLDADPF